MEQPSLTLRRMTRADIPAVMEIERQSAALCWPERSYGFEISENPAGRPWVAVSEDSFVRGFLILWVILDEIHVANFAVDPQWRRQGVGFALMKNGLTAGWNEGARVSFLEVRSGNQAAIGLYEKLGYETVGVRKKYYQDNQEDALMMNLETAAYRGIIQKWGEL